MITSQADEPKVRIIEHTAGGPTVEFVLGDFTRTRKLYDFDGDGWCDLWCAMFPDVKHRNKLTDTDGDGLTDYQEMVLMRNPKAVGPMPRHLTPEELAEAVRLNELRKRESEAMMRAKHADRLLVGQEAMANANAKNMDSFRPDAVANKERMHTLATDMKRKTDGERPIIKAHAKLLSPMLKDGGASVHRIGANGQARLMGTDNVVAADTISSDELWPGGASPLPDVTGSGLTIGVWEAGGGVFGNHVEFGPRVTQEDNLLSEGLDTYHFHATSVAGTLAAAGVRADARGASYEANLKSYGSVGDYAEMMSEASNGLILSNHSYSPLAGWFLSGSQWIWVGPTSVVGEDPVFGGYDSDSRNIDVIAYSANKYLSVHSSGNEADDYGPVSSVEGLITPGISYLVNEDVNPVDGFLDTSTVNHPNDSGLPQAGSVLFQGNLPKMGLGFDTIKTTGCAKNNLSVGSIRDIVGGVISPTQPFIVPSSSRGPTDDGRIKPDLVGNGDLVISPIFTSAAVTNSYTDDGTATGISGTSFSTPSITGALGLLQNVNEAQGGREHLSSTWKALILNTASDGTDVPSYYGTSAASASLVGPDYIYGWGVANVEEAANIIDDNLQTRTHSVHLREHMLFDGNTIEIPIEHDGASPEMRIMICWTDPAYQDALVAGIGVGDGVPDSDVGPADDSTLRLINDLDLRVVTPSSSTLTPWVLDPASPLVAATNGDNFRDNVEQIVIETPVAGTYSVQISHKGQLRAADLVVLGEPEYDANNPKYRLVSGREQAVSLCITGNKELPSDFLTAAAPLVVGNSVLLELQSFIGVRYQLEGSEDLLTWIDIGAPVDTAQVPQPLTVIRNPSDLKKFYRYREITPLN